MAMAIITIKIMPESPDVDLTAVQATVEAKIDEFTKTSGEKRIVIEPIAFGLNALKVTFVMDEKIGGTDSLELDIGTVEGVNSCEVIDVRRAIG